MPACPNCGRQTQRTKDWACEWCGYPLLSRAYKKIDKTYRELQEERNTSSRTGVNPRFKLESEPELENVPAHSSEDEEETPEEIPERPAAPVPPLPQVKKAPVARVKEEPKPVKSETNPPDRSENKPAPPPVMVTPPPQPVPELEPPPAAVVPPEPVRPPVIMPDLNTLGDEPLLTVDELDALFQTKRVEANAKLKDKSVIIKGFIEKVFIRDHIDVRYLMLTGVQKKLHWPVRCAFGKEIVSQVNHLSEGQPIVIRGKYDSYGKNIIFKDCTVMG
jgi:hypothetical protein